MKTRNGDDLTVIEVIMTVLYRFVTIITFPVWGFVGVIGKLSTELHKVFKEMFGVAIPEFIELPRNKKAREVAKRLKNG